MAWLRREMPLACRLPGDMTSTMAGHAGVTCCSVLQCLQVCPGKRTCAFTTR